ncbi:hypothetical protein O4J56_31230 [Nocardiopsis sp. RSe5-2]|uniref:DUF4333 domain-containing protein n=1 Tax=Nocardiopsis endophytica TaxID=3018445 RepID=A0ABT4UDV7_9ACTN|nr:hypothetical protein [Nocardiopsis endophytica]MDA2815156.1 hypothetical protein [Nocardiopsis endophytica]
MEPPIRTLARRAALALACAGTVAASSACGLVAYLKDGELPPDRDGAAPTVPSPSLSGSPESPGGSAPDGSPPGDGPSGGASPEDEPPAGEFRTGQVPAEEPVFDERSLGPAPPPDDFTASVEYEIKRFVNAFGMEYDPESAVECGDLAPEDGATGSCEASYMGYEAVFEVTVTGPETFEYETGRLPVSRAAVEERYRYHTGQEEVRCEMDEYTMVTSASSGIECVSAAGDRAVVEVSSDGSGVAFDER